MQRVLPIAIATAVVIASVPFPGSSVRAASPPSGSVIVCDSSDDRVVRFEDVDGSGAFEPDVEGEISIFYDSSGGGPELSLPSHLAAAPDGAVYLLDGGTLDAVLVLRDLTGDGDAADAGEVTVFYDDTAAGPELSTPNTLLAAPDGSLLVSDDGSAAGFILRLQDLDGDGAALGPGESVVVYDKGAAPVILEDPESMAWSAEGDLLVGDSTLETVFRLSDLDGNGDYLGEGEVGEFFRGGDAFSLTDIDAIAVGDSGAVYVADEDSGVVVRLEDLDGDGDALGAGEAAVFVDDGASERVRDLNDMQIVDGESLLLLDGAADSIFMAHDANGDGDALDEGEVTRLLLDDGETLATPSGILGTSTRAVEAEFVRGDANADSEIDISDAVATLVFLFFGSEDVGCPDAMDVDDSGALNVTDPIYALTFLFLGGSAPPPPFPEPGRDPTADDLPCDKEQ